MQSLIIFLSFSKSTFSEEEKRDYQVLKKLRVQGTTHLTMELLKLRSRMEADFPSVYQRTMDEVSAVLSDLVIEDRILLNWVAPLAVFHCLEAYLDTSLSYKQMLEICVEGIRTRESWCCGSN